MRTIRRLLRVLLPVALAGTLASAAPAPCSRVVAVGDLHGGHEAFLSILRETGILDERGRWIGGNACLVQTGDVVDRGDRSREILDLIKRLTSEKPERVHFLLGNHEVMNVVGDLRYVTPEECAAFAPEETTEERERGYRLFLEARPDLPPDEASRRAVFDEAYPEGWFAHRRAFGPDGRYGSWLLSRPAALALQRTLFVHGGISPEDAALGVEELNRRVHREILDYLETRDALVRAGTLDPLVPFGADFSGVKAFIEASLRAGASGDELAMPRRFLALAANRFSGEDGPLWNRSLALADETEFAPTLETILDRLDVDRVVVGHTTQDDGRIGVRFGGRVFLIDTGAGPAYDGRPGALEIAGSAVRAVYVGESEVLAAPPELSDAKIERFLLGGDVVESEEIPTGISKPRKVVLDFEGRRRRAAFKTIDINRSGVTRFDSSRAEAHFTDSYRYDRAAYRLDRWLGMNMVPVVVLRRLGDEEGALVDWVEDAIDEQKRRERDLQPPNSLDMQRQKATMELFDALIHNTDRNLGNQLITTRDWRLHLIDHTRAFGTHTDLLERFADRPAHVTRALYERLRTLEAEPLNELLGDVLTKARVKALLARARKIVEKIDGDRKRLGDEIVFFD